MTASGRRARFLPPCARTGGELLAGAFPVYVHPAARCAETRGTGSAGAGDVGPNTDPPGRAQARQRCAPAAADRAAPGRARCPTAAGTRSRSPGGRRPAATRHPAAARGCARPAPAQSLAGRRSAACRRTDRPRFRWYHKTRTAWRFWLRCRPFGTRQPSQGYRADGPSVSSPGDASPEYSCDGSSLHPGPDASPSDRADASL